MKGVFHTIKAKQYMSGLKKWLDSNPTAASGDRAAAENVLKDLQNSLRGNSK